MELSITCSARSNKYVGKRVKSRDIESVLKELLGDYYEDEEYVGKRLDESGNISNLFRNRYIGKRLRKSNNFTINIVAGILSGVLVGSSFVNFIFPVVRKLGVSNLVMNSSVVSSDYNGLSKEDANEYVVNLFCDLIDKSDEFSFSEKDTLKENISLFLGDWGYLYNKDSLRISFLNKGRAICDMKATFLLYDREKCENILEPKEYYMPMLVSDSYWHLKLDLNETFWYKAVYGLVTNSNKNLYCIYSFVDTNSGQSSIRVTEITKDYFDNLNYVEFTKDYVLSNKDLLPIENGGKLNLERINNYTKLTYSFKRKDSDNSFVMLYYNFYEKFLNLEKYDKSNTYLLLDIKGIDVTIKFEIKLNNNVNITRVINVDNELVKIYLEDITELLENVKEICYTIFKSDNKLNGEVEIGDLKIITK